MTVLLAVSLLFALPACVQAAFGHPAVGKPASSFTLPTLKGQTFDLVSEIKGKKAILFFWATWCPHCREQLKDLQDRQDELAAAGVKVVLVNIGEQKGAVEKFLAARGLTQDVILDLEGRASETYQVYGIPALYYVGADGIIRAADHGLLADYAKVLE